MVIRHIRSPKGEHTVTVQTKDDLQLPLAEFSIYVDTDISGTIGKNDEVTWVDKEDDPERIVVSGPIGEEHPVWIASYDRNGRMVSADELVQSGGSSEVKTESKTIKILWIDKLNLPKCKNARILK